MAIELLELLANFEAKDDRETENALYRTGVPWVGPSAYLNIIFKPLPENHLLRGVHALDMPQALVEFLKKQNGAFLFSGDLSVYGIHLPGQLLNREDPFFDLPFNIELENENWPPYDRKRFLAIGGYGFDGSTVCIDRTNSQILLFARENKELSQAASMIWASLDDWLTNEIARISMLFDKHGKRLVDESRTVPTPTSSV